MTEVPPSQDEFDDADELYRRASALDGGRPSEPVRRAILKHAAELAAARALDNAGRKAVKRPPARQAWWRPAAFGTLAAAALAGLLVTPQFITHHTPNTTASSPQNAAKSAPAAVPSAPAAPSAPATPSVSAATNAPAPQNEPKEEIVVTEQRAAKAEQRAAKAEQYTSQLSARNAASQPAAQDELQERASADAQDKRRAANDLNEPSKLAEQSKASAASDYSVPAAAPAAAQAGASTAGGGASTALNGLVAGRPAGLMDPAALLRRAADTGDVTALRALLDKQPAIDARDAGGRTALMLATLRGRAEAVEVLLSAGADPNAADARGTTPLQAALAGQQPAIAEALRRAGAR